MKKLALRAVKLALLVIITAVVVFVAPKPAQRNDSININRIQTDATQTFPYSELIACQWFVEQVNPVN